MSEVDDVDDVDAPQHPARTPLTPAQRRARRQAVTLLLVGGLLLVAFLFAAAYYGGWFDKPKAKAAPCTTVATAPKVQPSQVRVNVYNASKRNGLAKSVSGQMRQRGFVIGKVANDPLGATVKTPAQVRYGTKGKAGAQLVTSEVPGAKLVKDKRKDATVDLVLGSSYSTLTGAKSTASPSATCTPASTSTTTAPPKSTKTTKTSAKPSPTTSKKP